MDVVVVLLALAAALDVVLRHDLRAPRSPLWFSLPAVALLVLALLARRRFPFAAPAAVWLAAAAVSVVDGWLIVFATGAVVAGYAASFLLGRVPDAAQARVGLAVVVISSAVVVRNDPGHPPADVVLVPVSFALAWAAGYAGRVVADRASLAEERAGRAEREREHQDEPDVEADQQRVDERISRRQVVREPRRHAPAEHAHRQRHRREDGEDPALAVLPDVVTDRPVRPRHHRRAHETLLRARRCRCQRR
jgi:hypothetical protein